MTSRALCVSMTVGALPGQDQGVCNDKTPREDVDCETVAAILVSRKTDQLSLFRFLDVILPSTSKQQLRDSRTQSLFFGPCR
jgi:hypothetical protein